MVANTLDSTALDTRPHQIPVQDSVRPHWPCNRRTFTHAGCQGDQGACDREQSQAPPPRESLTCKTLEEKSKALALKTPGQSSVSTIRVEKRKVKAKHTHTHSFRRTHEPVMFATHIQDIQVKLYRTSNMLLSSKKVQKQFILFMKV